MVVFGEPAMLFGIGLGGPLCHQSYQSEAVDNFLVSVVPRQSAEPLPPLVDSLEPCEPPKREAQDRDRDHPPPRRHSGKAHGLVPHTPISSSNRLMLHNSSVTPAAIARVIFSVARRRQKSHQ
jgi:hypothetical protein